MSNDDNTFENLKQNASDIANLLRVMRFFQAEDIVRVLVLRVDHLEATVARLQKEVHTLEDEEGKPDA